MSQFDIDVKKGNNVVNLPRENARRVQFMKLRENNRVVTAASIFSVMAIVTLLNHTLLEVKKVAQTDVSGRGIASVGSAASVSYDKAWQDKLAQDLTKTIQSERVIMARNPSQLDQFRFGELEGKYAVKISPEGVVQELALASPDREPNMLKDPQAFLEKNSQVLGFASVEVKAVDASHYEFTDAKGVSIAQADFELDAQNRLLSLKINKK